MKILDLVNRDEVAIDPYASIASIEAELIRNAYVVLRDGGGTFVGILTPSDVLEKGHNLAIDCLTERPLIKGDEDAEKVMNMMLDRGILVLPVGDARGAYLGSVQVTTMLQRIWDITKQNISINWVNIVEEPGMERHKDNFSMELFHNTRNPIQAIVSAVDMLRASPGDFETKLLLNAIDSNARILDALVIKLYSFHFEKR